METGRKHGRCSEGGSQRRWGFTAVLLLRQGRVLLMSSTDERNLGTSAPVVIKCKQ